MVAPITLARRAEMARRRELVAELMLSGATERQMTERLKVSAGTVHNDVVAVRQEWAKNRMDTYEKYVDAYDARLRQLERRIAQLITEGDLGAIDRALKILDQRARLLGLNAPTRMDVRSDDPISNEIRVLAEKLGVMDDPTVRAALGEKGVVQPEKGPDDESEIVDAEIVET